MTIRKLRRQMYRGARLLGDVDAVASGDPNRILRRAANKWMGRTLIRRMWF